MPHNRAPSLPGTDSDLDFLSGDGEMARTMRARDWDATPLGPPRTWPQALRTCVRLMLNTQHPIFIFWGPQATCLYNDGYRTLLGWERQAAALGSPGAVVWDEIWRVVGPQVARVMAGKGATWHENDLIPLTRHGQLEDAYWTYSYSPIDDEGGVGGVLVLITETTQTVLAEKRRTEGTRQALLLELLQGHRETDDPDAIIRDAVMAVGKHLGVSRAGFFLMPEPDTIDFGLCWTDGSLPDLSGPWATDNIGAAYRQAKRGGFNPGVADVTTDPLTAGSRFMDLGARAVVSAAVLRGGRPLGGIYAHHAQPRAWPQDEIDFIRDVADQTWDAVARARSVVALRESEQRMADARNAAEAANIAKTDFLANMSHEIRTPMNAIIGAAEILHRSSPLSDRQKLVIDVLRDGAGALMELINQVLDLSKIESRNLQLEHAPFDARLMVDEIARMLDLQARSKGLTLKVVTQCACVGERLFIGDVARIRQVLVNLCSNAVKFTQRGGITVSLRCEPARIQEIGTQEIGTHDIEQLIFEVEDTGIGIAADNLGAIFTKFSQADSSINRKYGGTGLGLSISRSLTEAMGGTLHAESRLGEGSRFVVSLPLERAEREPSAKTPDADIGPTDVLAGARILLVEDSPANVMVASHYLDAFQSDFEVAEDGEKVVTLVRSGRNYDVILMDVQMPGMDGLEATRQIRAYELESARTRTPIIAMTAHAMVADRERCLTAGMDDYIAKPFNPDVLKEKLVAAVSRRAQTNF